MIDQPKLFLICPDKAESGALETLPPTQNLQIIKTNNLMQSNLRFSATDKVCITSEASIDIVKDRLDNPGLIKAIDTLKDKSAFRAVLKSMYPNYMFKNVIYNDIKNIRVNSKMVLKPSKGCFGTAVKIIDENTNMDQLTTEISNEIEKNSDVLSESVLSKNEFILEDYISGDEYAVDMFFDGDGKPHIVNIYHHPLPHIPDYLHMIYYTGKTVFEILYDKAIHFFENLNSILGIRNIVLHSEFKLQDDTLFPIEINAMRFGGMGLGNLVYHALGIDPYNCFINGQSPDWESIWNNLNDQNNIYAFFIAYNGTSVDKNKMKPNIDMLKSKFTKILRQELFDYKNQLAFGVFCLEETHDNLKNLLAIDFNDYFEPI